MARPASLVVALVVAALAVVWAFAAWWLWQTVIPDGLRLPTVEASDVLSRTELAVLALREGWVAEKARA